jgi:hypothetical protein
LAGQYANRTTIYHSIRAVSEYNYNSDTKELENTIMVVTNNVGNYGLKLVFDATNP